MGCKGYGLGMNKPPAAASCSPFFPFLKNWKVRVVITGPLLQEGLFEDSERSSFSEGESQSEDGGSDSSDGEPSFDSEAENQPPCRTTRAAAAGKGKKTAADERAGWRAG